MIDFKNELIIKKIIELGIFKSALDIFTSLNCPGNFIQGGKTKHINRCKDRWNCQECWEIELKKL